MSDLGGFIKSKREKANLSLKELGMRCGISDAAIQRIETGQTKKPCWENLCKIAQGLEIHPLVMMKKAGYITDQDIAPSCTLERLNKLNCSDIQLIQSYIDFIIFQRNTKIKQKEEL